MSKLKDAAVRLFHKRERERMRCVFMMLDPLVKAVDSNPSKPSDTKIWFWAKNRWPDFPDREFELREYNKE